MSIHPCHRCGGLRLKPEALAVRIKGRNIAEYSALSVREAVRAFGGLDLTQRQMEITRRVLKEINERLMFLSDVGLDYLTLNRASATLAGGRGSASGWPPRSAPAWWA